MEEACITMNNNLDKYAKVLQENKAIIEVANNAFMDPLHKGSMLNNKKKEAAIYFRWKL